MSRKIRTLREKSILIVCEGAVTEYNYFKAFEKLAKAEGTWDIIEIKPKPSSEEQDEPKSQPSSHKSQRTSRKSIGRTLSEADEVEERYNYKQTPVSYVKEARDGLKDDTFSEAWAVFDRDGHPGHNQAFDLAKETINGKPVRIAFSSIAFEHWILLHFEKNTTAFVKSECKHIPEKRRDEESLECGTGIHPGDCGGTRCASGYLRVKKYWKGSTKKREYLFNEMAQLTSPALRQKAYENAAWLRYTVAQDTSKPFLTNPYSNVDELAKRLLGEENLVIEWARFREVKIWESLNIHAEISNSTIKLVLQNIGKTTVLLNGSDIALFLCKGDEKAVLRPDPKERELSPGGVESTYIFPMPDDLLSCDTFEIKRGDNRLLFQCNY